MRRPAPGKWRLGVPGRTAGLALLLIIVGGLLFLRPHLQSGQELVAGVPAPPALAAITPFSVAPHGRACMSSVTIDAGSALAQFDLAPARPTKHGGPPVDLLLSAPGYRGVVKVPGGYPGGSATLPIVPTPKRSEIGSACFVDVGKTAVVLNGTTEARTVSRSSTLVDGQSVAGDIALTFLGKGDRSLLDEINETFDHASNLTDGLVPAWLIWVLGLLVLGFVTLGTVAAFYLALREDEASGALPKGRPRSGPRASSG
jgi:hypothetical protein